ncbi:hypothetical protein SCL_0179 [Sulfuricaulis limicola]|uniref:Uncharacterized protein n=1 Tax=Sulfuricaulis limicola TaxID=1620215 RepID=A0A1B4XCF3_9GAMM|nr:hypothetical protein [Sulfuricaulis limicola]BAV32503.1 hypothetical protein SCL_0179 [Sulfuricaulis limicola]
MRLIGCFCLLLMAGCAGVERAPPESSAPPPEMAATEPAKPGPADAAVARTEPPAAGIPAKLPAEPSVKKPDATPVPAKKATPPPLDLTALETRLKETKAIGVFTKITLKNQVDDLLEQFRAYYQGRAKTSLAELRRPYDGLVLKVLSLLQDGDPELAHAIVASREAIWGILADPNKFATL